MTEYVPIYHVGRQPEELEGWAVLIDRDPIRYLSTGMVNPFVFGHVRFLSSHDAVGRLFRHADVLSEAGFEQRMKAQGY